LEVLYHDHLNGSLPNSNQVHPSFNNSADKEVKLQNVLDTPQQKDPNAINSEMSNSGHSGDHNVCPWTDNDRIMNSPCDLQLLLRYLIMRIPFSYAHFNDGEIKALQQDKGKTDRGLQTLSPRLQHTMHNAFHQNISGLIFGIPCRMQFESAYKFAVESLADHTNIQLTHANLFIDSNYQIARSIILAYLRKNQEKSYSGRRVHMVVGDAANFTSFYKHTALRNGTVNFIKVPSLNAFPKGYDDNIDMKFEKDDIVIICAGPLGRILAVEWFTLSNSTTFLEMGSFFDIDLYDKSLGATYYDGRRKFGSCNDPRDKDWEIQKNRLLETIDAGQ